MRSLSLPLLLIGMSSVAAGTTAAAEFAFSRIISGWTNYSTAFATTHDISANGEFATVGTLYTPPYTVRALEFTTIVIWSELPPDTIRFSDFTFSVCVWSGLDQFIANPAVGDVANLHFAQPTAIVRDGVSRGGRPTYGVRFALTNSPLVLTSCQPYAIGVIARTDTSRNGELYVPTAPTEGFSDVQAGSIVPFGWQYLVDAGGLTIYSGQLATELLVAPLAAPPTLHMTATTNSSVRVSWPVWANCYGLEAAASLGGSWVPVTNQTTISADVYELILPRTHATSFYRLRTLPREPDPEPPE